MAWQPIGAQAARPSSVAPIQDQRRRTPQQNRLYWGVVIPRLANALGETPQAVHEFLKVEFNPEILVVGKRELRRPKSTATLDPEGFTEYLERVRRWAAAELGLDLMRAPVDGAAAVASTSSGRARQLSPEAC